MKEKDIILSDFLLRQTHDDSNTYDLIPISFNMHNMLFENYIKLRQKRDI